VNIEPEYFLLRAWESRCRYALMQADEQNRVCQ